MNKKEIKDYLKRVYELGNKLTGEDKETYTWLIYGYNQCAKLLNETEQQCKKQKEVIDKALNFIEDTYYSKNTTDIDSIVSSSNKLIEVRKILKEVE